MDLKLKKQFRGETNLDVFVWDKNNNVAFTEAYVNWLEKQCTIANVVVPKGALCCPECKSTDLKVAIHTDYNECNKCYHYWET
jgi:hypothetical protein